MGNPESSNKKPLLVFILSKDGIFELLEIWSVLHRQSDKFDLVLLDENEGKTKVPPAITKAALKTYSAKDATAGKIINALAVERENEIFAFLSDKAFPTHDHWLKRLCEPILTGEAGAAFGREIPAPGGNYFLNRELEKTFPADGIVEASALTIDNCAIAKNLILKSPFPEKKLNDPAAVWTATVKPKAKYCPSAMVMRHTLLTIRGIYTDALEKGEDFSSVRKKPGFASVLWQTFSDILRDIVFAFSIKRPQYVWYPFLYRVARNFGYYFGAGKK
jgi:hypothetical protein